MDVSHTTSNPPTSEDDASVPPGRVVRLHFCCKAELPIGSLLRVTGSTLWAPAQLTAQDPTNAHHISVQETSQAMPTTSALGEATPGGEGEEQLFNFASSVEMVTTPSTYPIWKTRRPVIVVLYKRNAQLQHHYYRYMVVTPGANNNSNTSTSMGEEERLILGQQQQQVHVTSGGTTSNEDLEISSVMAWEDPFWQQHLHHEVSTTSMVSMEDSQNQTRYLASLPYRTLDINVEEGSVIIDPEQPQVDGISMDTWNNGDDGSFRPYLIREAINEENRKLNQRKATSTSMSMEDSIHRSTDADTGTPPVFNKEQRIFFVCYHLPVVVVKDPTTNEWKASWSESLMAKTEGSRVVSSYNAHWVGTVSPHPPIETLQDKEKVTALLAEMDCIPVFLDPSLAASHYNGFCKQVLWPAFHNIDLLDLSKEEMVGWDQSKLDNWWQAYQQVNGMFAHVMSNMVKQNDIIWVHDYHLSLLPQLLQELEILKTGRVMSRKVFFLHIPFPTSQIFRELECGEAILQGILHANVVGFHAFDHARHFLNAAKRILGLDYESMVGGLIGVHFQGKTVLVTMSNVSIEPRMADAAMMLPTVQAGCQELKQKHGDRMIIGGLDIGQRLSGVSLKLLAFERLLQDYPSWQGKVVMVQRVLLPNSRQSDEASTVRELRFIVKRIQDTFGPHVIDYQEMAGTSMPMDQRLALWKASDVLMLTPIREGLNHWPMEYIYARKEPNPPGVVIASEFSAVCSILNGALRVNPFDIQMTVTTLDKALSMDLQEREGRRYRDIDFVSTCPSAKWTQNVLRDLRDAVIRQPSENRSSSSTPGTPLLGRKELIDSTAAYLGRESSIAFTQLNPSDVKKAFDSSSRRVLIFDFNGTIVIKEPPGKYLKREILGTSGNKPPPEVIEALTDLCADPKNSVYVVSGDSSENVVNAIGHIPMLGLAASNGGHFSPPTPAGTKRTWQTFDLGVDWEAVKRVALPVLSKYTARSNGSFVKLTHLSIGWSYYSCDPEWGSLQASHLVLELENELRAFDVRFVTLKGVVEIVPRKLNKGLLVKKVLRESDLTHDQGVDFILCCGDDISDEKMFTSVFSYIAELGDEENAKPTPPVIGGSNAADDTQMSSPHSTDIRDPMYCYTVAVGRKPSRASNWVENAQAVAELLVTLSKGEQESSTQSWGRASPTSLFS